MHLVFDRRSLMRTCEVLMSYMKAA